jgi:dienelactone hydrolase
MNHKRIAWSLVAWIAFLYPAINSTNCPAQESVQGSTPSVLPLKDLDGHFPFRVPESLDAWKSRSEKVKKQLLVSLGLWPRPTMANLSPVVHSPRQMDGYSISKVYFESLPGLYVTGSLFLPDAKQVKSPRSPAVLCPHGHWVDGRFYWANDGEVKGLLATGAERFEAAARNHMQARCVQLARMGCVVFQYDMLGYADSQQINFDRAHRFGLAGPNPKVGPGEWLLYSPTAEGHLQSIMALQTINSLQAFEFLAQRADVDPSRIAITGASGGGTQSFIAAAIEPRISCAFPAVMVSTGMQGGCTCENACSLRVNTGNVEIAALIAPRPLGMTAADDWTRNMATDGFPELQKLYGLFGAKEKVRLFPAVHFPHNYNHVSRVAMYGFLNRHFQLGFNEPILERDFEVLKREDLSVWDAEHPAPPSGTNFEAGLLKAWAGDVASQLAKSPALATEGWSALLEPATAIAETLSVHEIAGPQGTMRLEARNALGSVVGELNLPRSESKGSLQSIQILSEPTKNSALATLIVKDPNGYPNSQEQALVKNPRPAASYTYGYNAPLAVRKAAVLIKLLDSYSGTSPNAPKVSLQGTGELGFVAAAAKQLRPNVVESSTSDKPIDFSQVDSIRDPLFVPGALRFGPIAN